MNDPKVSIIIPVYNGEKFLKETIESCLNQDYRNIEIIVVDDCSTDNSAEIIRQYEKITKIKNDENLGINKSVNNAVKVSNGEYFMFLGHDDKLKPDHISNILSEFELNTVFVYCNSIIIDENNIEKSVTYNNDINKIKNIKFEIAKRNIISSTGLIIRKKSFIDVGGYTDKFRNYGEWHLWIKLLSIGDCKYSAKSKAYYRRHNSNITNTFHNRKTKIELIKYYNYSRKEAFKKYYNEFTLSEKAKFLTYYNNTRLKSYVSMLITKT